MVEGNSSEEPIVPNSRKNSILVKAENNGNRNNLQSVHPHFVEQILPHRSPPGSVSGPAHSDYPSTTTHSQQHSGAVSSDSLHPGAAHANTASQGQSSIPSKLPPSTPSAAAQERLDHFHLGTAMSGGSSASNANDPNAAFNYPGSAHFPGLNQGAPTQGALLAQAQADAQNSAAPSAAGSAARSRQQSSVAQSLGPSSHPSRVGSPMGPSGTDPDGQSSAFTGRATSKQPSDPRIPMDDGKIHILLGVTGSLHISSVKSIISKLLSIYGDRVAIQVIVTPAAEKLVASSSAAGKESKESKEGKATESAKPDQSPAPQGTQQQIQPVHQQPSPASSAAALNQTPPVASQKEKECLSGMPHPNLREKEPHPNLRIWHDSDEWETWRGRNDPVIHIELRRWADILVIAPLSANTLGKIAMGLCDNLLTNVVRAWNAQYPILIAPAMVTYAYNHPATKHHLKIIREEMKWIEILRPTEKVAGSTGGIGMGGMMPWNEIVDRVVHKLGGYPDDDDEYDDDDDDDDDSPRRRPTSGDLDDEDDDLDEEEDEDGDILKEGIEGSRQPSPTGSPI